jgi:hypothetical protein
MDPPPFPCGIVGGCLFGGSERHQKGLDVPIEVYPPTEGEAAIGAPS